VIGIDLGGKIMLITGGLGAIAEHIVRKIVAADATVILVDIKSSEHRKHFLMADSGVVICLFPGRRHGFWRVESGD